MTMAIQQAFTKFNKVAAGNKNPVRKKPVAKHSEWKTWDDMITCPLVDLVEYIKMRGSLSSKVH